MSHSFIADEQMFWIAHSEDALEHGVVDAGEHFRTGQKYLETYTSPRQFSIRLTALRTNYEKARDEWIETLRLREPLAHLADYRWRKETGGLTLTTGETILTTRESQSQMTSTITALTEGMVQEPVQWKAQSGWVSWTQAEIKAAATEVATHVAKCFSAEELVAVQIETDPTLDVEAVFDLTYAGL